MKSRNRAFRESVRSVCLFLLLSGLCCLCSSLFIARAAEPPQPPEPIILDSEDLVRVLQQGGCVIYFRHEATDHQQIDADVPNFADCSTQRNLSEAGRHRARRLGQAFRALGIEFDRVITSPFCRARQTGELAFGKEHLEINENLYFAMKVDLETKAHLRKSLLQLLSTPPREGKNTILVAHTANLKEAMGIWPKPEGVAHIFKPEDTGSTYLGSILPDRWPALAAMK